jgi:regulator of CtrA degradation
MTDIGARQQNTNTETLIDFMARFATSEQFNKVFQEGMSLVEETANYLDGPGRQDARALDRHGSIAYATESMRLTTRLMQLASWLLLQRAVSAGELSEDDAVKEKTRINLEEIGPGSDLSGGDQLPESLMDLVNRSLTLHQRVMRLDQMISERAEISGDSDNPVGDQVGKLQEIFAAGQK